MNGITTIIAWIILAILSGMVDYAFFFGGGGINYNNTTLKSGFHEWLPPSQLFFFKHPPIC